MKRVVSIALVVLMLFSVFTTASAETNVIPNPLNMELSMKVEAKEAGADDASYSASLPLTIGDGEIKKGVDYRATLDMEGIRDLFSHEFIEGVLGGSQSTVDRFNDGDVETTINVVINYPATAIVEADLSAVGDLDAGDIFEETSRVVENNSVKITYKNDNDLKVSDLNDDENGPLKDIVFTLENAISYNNNGNHQVAVTLSGSTVIDFGTKVQTVNYNGASSHIVTATKHVAEHILEVVPVIPATCVSKGWTEGVICRTHNSYECGAKGTVEPQPTSMIPHNLTFIEEVPSTCSATGMKAHDTCIYCKKDFVNGVEVAHSSLIIPKREDTLVDIPAVEPTCTKSGLTAGRKCVNCGTVHTAQEEVSALGHREEAIPGKAATCDTAGLTEGKHCSRCGLVTVSQKVIPALGHSYGDWVVTQNPSENAVGSKTKTCTVCGDTVTVEIPKLAHTHRVDEKSTVILTAPTCESTGLAQQYCACGEAYGDPITVPALKHELSHITAVPATCVSEGIVEHYECANCGNCYRNATGKAKMNSVVEAKDKKNHGGNIVDISPVAATCTTQGLTAGKKCKACNVVTEKQKVTKKTEHILEIIEAHAATCTEEGVIEHKHCKICNKDFDMKGKKELQYFKTPALGHAYGPVVVITPPSEIAVGEGTKTCERCDDAKTVDIAMLLHQHNEVADEIIKAETCTESGLKRTIHSCCGEVIENNIVIPAHPHTMVFVPRVESTCFVEGTEAYYLCSECHKMFSSTDSTVEIEEPVALAKKVHNFIPHTATSKICEHCDEIVNVSVEDGVDADVKDHGGIQNETDKAREEVVENINIESDIKITKREEVSPALAKVLPGNEKQEKVVLDIVIEKVTTYDNGDKDIEFVPEVDELIEFEIVIPSILWNMKQYNVLRMHNGNTEEIKTTKNNDGEYIVIDTDTHRISVFVKKFSEYAVIAFEEETVVIPEVVTSSGVSSNTYTVKFNANGGTLVADAKVKQGSTVKEPVTTREGYEFTGWYTDTEFTQLFDFNTPIKYNMTLYAGWKESGDGWFTDVNRGDWFYDSVKYVYDKGFMNGISDKLFDPYGSVTRAMFVTILYRIENEPGFVPSQFVDLEVDSWYEDAVHWAYENGITLGVSDTEFAPDRIIIREQIVAMLYRYALVKGYDVSAGQNTNILSYEDALAISEYAVPSFQWAVGDGIMNGKSETTLNPKDNATRAEASALMMRLYEKYNK